MRNERKATVPIAMPRKQTILAGHYGPVMKFGKKMGRNDRYWHWRRCWKWPSIVAWIDNIDSQMNSISSFNAYIENADLNLGLESLTLSFRSRKVGTMLISPPSQSPDQPAFETQNQPHPHTPLPSSSQPQPSHHNRSPTSQYLRNCELLRINLSNS